MSRSAQGRQSRWRLFVVFTLGVYVLVGCSGGRHLLDDGGLGDTLSGLIEVVNFVIPAGETKTVVGDLVIIAEKDIQIDGTLLVQPNATLAMSAGKRLVLNGTIKGTGAAAPSRVLRSRAAPRGRTLPATSHPTSSVPDEQRRHRLRRESDAASPALSSRKLQRSRKSSPEEASSNTAAPAPPVRKTLASRRAERQSAQGLVYRKFQGAETDFMVGRGGDDIIIKGNLEPLREGVALSTSSNKGTIVIEGTIISGNGLNGNGRGARGGDAGDIEIGTDKAIQLMKGRGFTAKRPAKVTIQGRLVGGVGGTGGFDAEGVLMGRTLDFLSGDGGNGGDIAIAASEIELPQGAGEVRGGLGGFGGLAGGVGTHAPDGTMPGEQGVNVKATSGNGGDGGSLALNANSTQPGNIFVGGGGIPGGFSVSAGNGGPGGAGGDTEILVGVHGKDGTSPIPPGRPDAPGKVSVAALRNGGKGGDSNDPNLPGGRGGFVSISTRDSKESVADVVEEIKIDSYGNGGNGFNGCVVAPIQNGTKGGNAGTVPGQSELTALSRVAGVKVTIESRSFTGGNGGDGSPIFGAGGSGGFDERNNRLGENGSSGKLCTNTELGVTLAHTLVTKINGQTVIFNAGEIIALSRIAGEFVQGPDRGCDKDHVHALSGTVTIDGSEPIPDPDPQGCGLGPTVLIPKQSRINRPSPLQRKG